MTNTDRANRAINSLNLYVAENERHNMGLRDMMIDLLHLAAKDGGDVSEIIEFVTDRFHEEVSDEED